MFEEPFSSELLENQVKKDHEFGNLINSSGFNPPPYHRKSMGDLYYLHVKTLEEIDLHLTANYHGFYVNQSTQGNFNPNPHPKYVSCFSLLDLLLQISPKFKLKFFELQKTMKLTEFQRISLGEKLSDETPVWMVENRCWKKGNVWRNDCTYNLQRNDFSGVRDWV